MGAGLVSNLGPMMSPAQRERLRRDAEREDEELEEHLRRERIAEQDWLQRGEVRHSVSAKLAEVAAAGDREDRREERQAHPSDCGRSTCDDRKVGAGPLPPPRRLPSGVAAENAAGEKAFMDQPADIGLVAHMVGAVEDKLDRVVSKLTGRE
jgi:hypothetical protein